MFEKYDGMVFGNFEEIKKMYNLCTSEMCKNCKNQCGSSCIHKFTFMNDGKDDSHWGETFCFYSKKDAE